MDRRFAGLIALLCRRDWLVYAEVLTPLSRIVSRSSEAAAHAPGSPEMLITVSDELRWS